MPVLILPTRDSVKIKDDVKIVPATDIHNVIQQFETRVFDNSRVVVIDEMAIVEWHSDTVQSKTLEVCGIRIGEEVMDQAVKEELCLFFAQNFSHCGPMFVFMTRISSNEILEVQMTTKTCTLQNDL